MVLVTSLAHAELKGTVQGGKIDPLPMAITPFIADGASGEAAASISEVVTNDLASTGYFNPLPPESFVEQITNFDQEPRYGDWRQVAARALVTGQAVMNGDKMQVSFKLFDVNSQQMLAARAFLPAQKTPAASATRSPT